VRLLCATSSEGGVQIYCVLSLMDDLVFASQWPAVSRGG
jgi:hypothetical protein